MKIKHKFKAVPCAHDGIRFASKKEGKRYLELRALKEKGEIVFFLRQTPFSLPGGVKYICDFTIFWADGSISFEDVKGFKTEIYKLKKKLVEANYPISIIET